MKDLIRKIEIHLETTEECIENTSLPPYVVELLEADNRLLSEVVTKYETERMYSEEDLLEVLKFFIKDTRGDKPWVDADDEWFEQFKKK
jgi:hypothetical protein